ncbi:lysylphosphatidylglycerol synthase domain-containing protein [Lysinibacter sp. HNR]|uniref:lysylphosphatidylglycerol synthase domain-containing protein n=1 Tax=Lysinibacter sp. HNR TaxID=3031408 RepID=UPI002434F183|nr:lysylphosphatidylglycerol synthase domain-containing protein [Lysinibacter sp. HNR]WGD38086.1 lysylphosphatidylglycerol synthase domain-containing protein [Lysinibacter sp. HNR]
MISKFKAAAPKIFLVLRYLLLAAVIGFALYYLVSQWSEVSKALKLISWPSLLVSFFFLLSGLFAGTMSWVSVLNGLGAPVSVPRGAQIMLVGQLGKYVPGSVWSYLMQMELGRQYGISRPRILITSLYAAGIGVVASLLLGALALPAVIQYQRELLWLFALLPVGLTCLHPRVMTWLASLVLKIFRRPPLDHIVSFKTVSSALGWALFSYLAYGGHLWILVNSLDSPTFMSFILLTGAISLGFTISLFAFILPSGVGIREVVLVGSMALIITASQATAITLVSRVMFTLADLAAAGIAVLTVVILKKRLPATTNEYAEPTTTAANAQNTRKKIGLG